MLLVIHNLPSNCKYADIKGIIQSKCGLSEVILDNLTSEGQTKRVTVGLADDGDGAILVRKINGLYLGGQQLYVEDVRQKKASEQPYRSSKEFTMPMDDYDNNSWNGSASNQVNTVQDMSYNYQAQNTMNMMNYNMATMAGMYYMPTVQPVAVPTQNSYLGYGNQQQQNIAPVNPKPTDLRAPMLERPFGFGNERAQETTYDWNSSNNRPSDKQRNSYVGNRVPSPVYDRTNDASTDNKRRLLRWDESNADARAGTKRRRSRSPRQRTRFDVRERSDNSQNRFDRPYEEPALRPPAPSLMSLNLQPNTSSYNKPSRNIDLSERYSPSFADFEPSLKTDVSRIFDNHTTQSAHVWEPPARIKNEPFQRTRFDAPNPRGDRNPNQRNDSRAFEPRNFNRAGPIQSRQDKRREETREPQKRESRWQNDEPPAKKFTPFKARENKWQEPAPQRSFNQQIKGSFNQQIKGSYNQQIKAEPKGYYNTQIKRERKPEIQETAHRNPVEDKQKILNKSSTWRGQAVSTIAKDMLKVLKIDIPVGDKIFTHLKRAIRDRIEAMLGDKIVEREQIAEMYGKQFPPSGNQEFFMHVVNDLKEKEAKDAQIVKATAADTSAKGSGPQVSIPKPNRDPVPTASQTKPRPGPSTVKAPIKKGPIKPLPKPEVKPGRLPSYPTGDKISHKKQKAEDKKEWHKEENYKLPDDLKKAADEEVDKLCDIFMGECTSPNPKDDKDKQICEQIADIVSDEFRKIVRIHVYKRVLKDHKNLVVRVHTGAGAHTQISAEHRRALETLLSGLGCIALQKSDRDGNLLLGHFDSYENMDAVIALGSAELEGGIQVLFKPFQMCGPPMSANALHRQHKEMLQKFLISQVDRSAQDLLQPDYVYDIKNIKTDNQQNEESTETKTSIADNVNSNPIETEPIKDVKSEEVMETPDDDFEIVAGIEDNVDDGDKAGIPEDGDDALEEADDYEDDNIDEDDLEDY